MFNKSNFQCQLRSPKQQPKKISSAFAGVHACFAAAVVSIVAEWQQNFNTRTNWFRSRAHSKPIKRRTMMDGQQQNTYCEKFVVLRDQTRRGETTAWKTEALCARTLKLLLAS